MPNTHLMQELTRDAFDAYFEQDESCKPVLVRLAKGKARRVKSARYGFGSLTTLRDHGSRVTSTPSTRLAIRATTHPSSEVGRSESSP